MAGSGKKWLIGCGVGCGATVLLAILLSVGGSLYMMKPFNKAIDAQEELTETFGARDAFIPPVQGVTPDRLETFLEVRRALVPLCEEFRRIGESFAAMNELDKGGDDPSKGEVFKAMGGLMGSVFGMVGNIGTFNQVRNEALLAHRMSLGEYIWIYVLAYNSWLGQEPNQDFDETEGRGYSISERKVIHALVMNHVEALEAAGMTEKAAQWKEEAGRMTRAESGVPFQDTGLPADLERQFLAFEDELQEIYCEATSSFELNRVKKKGLSIRSD